MIPASPAKTQDDFNIAELDVTALFMVGALFTARGFSYRTIRFLVLGGIDAPERLLFMDDRELQSISGLDQHALDEIARYRASGTTAIVGGPYDNSHTGAAWVYGRVGTVWTQQGSKLIGTGAVGHAEQGFSVALSADGTTAIAGGIADNRVTGAAWAHDRRDGVWTQTPAPFVGF